MEKIFFQNLTRKTIALVLAVILWAVANFEFDVERDIRVPLHLSNLPENLIVVSKLPENIDLSLRGPRNLLSSFGFSNKSVFVDLRKTKKGILKIDMKHLASDIVPREIDIVAARPSKLSLNIDRLTTKRLKVESVLGEPDSGYEISKKIKIVPKFVKVRGPVSQLAKLKTIETAKIKLEGEKSEFTVPVKVQLPSQYMEIPEGDLVNVTVHIKEVILTKEFRDVDIIPRNFENLEYSTNDNLKANLTFKGTYKAINKLTSDDIDVFIDGAEMGRSKGKKLKVKVNYPDSNLLELTGLNPKKINIKINRPLQETPKT